MGEIVSNIFRSEALIYVIWIKNYVTITHGFSITYTFFKIKMTLKIICRKKSADWYWKYRSLGPLETNIIINLWGFQPPYKFIPKFIADTLVYIDSINICKQYITWFFYDPSGPVFYFHFYIRCIIILVSIFLFKDFFSRMKIYYFNLFCFFKKKKTVVVKVFFKIKRSSSNTLFSNIVRLQCK